MHLVISSRLSGKFLQKWTLLIKLFARMLVVCNILKACFVFIKLAPFVTVIRSSSWNGKHTTYRHHPAGVHAAIWWHNHASRVRWPTGSVFNIHPQSKQPTPGARQYLQATPVNLNIMFCRDNDTLEQMRQVTSSGWNHKWFLLLILQLAHPVIRICSPWL